MKRAWVFGAVLLLLAGLAGPAVVAQEPVARPTDGDVLGDISPDRLSSSHAGIASLWPGPDGYGYLGQSTPFHYVDIRTTGTYIGELVDNPCVGPFPIGFPFNFYGENREQFYVSRNGYISFQLDSCFEAPVCPYPSFNNPNHIALMFTELFLTGQDDGVYYQTFASCPYPGYSAQQCLIVQYYNMRDDLGNVIGSFEVILTSGGDMIFQYEDGGTGECYDAAEGIQGNNVPGNYGLQYACRSYGSCPDGTAFKIGLPAGIVVSPDSTYGKSCSEDTVHHTFTVRNYTGQQDTFNIVCSGYSWPTVCPTTVGPIPHGGSVSLDIFVTVPEGLCLEEMDTANILVAAQSSPYTATVVVRTQFPSNLLPAWEDGPRPTYPTVDGVVYYWDAGDGPRVYYIGWNWVYGTAVEIFDPETRVWVTGPFQPDPNIRYLSDGCLGLSASGEDIIAVFNDTVSGATAWYLYNLDTNSWMTAPVPSGFPTGGLWGADVVSLLPYGQNVCYISGGATTPGGGNLNTLYRYDPAAHTVQNLGNFSFPVGVNFHASFYIPPGVINTLPGGGLCVAGGINNVDAAGFQDTQCYDLSTNSFHDMNADLGQMPNGLLGAADFVLDPSGPDYQLWLINGLEAIGSAWPYSMYYSALDDAWHHGPNPTYWIYRTEGDAYGMDAYAIGGIWGGIFVNFNLHLRQPCRFWGSIHGYVMDYEEGCVQALCMPAVVHVTPSGSDLPVDAGGHYTVSVPVSCTYEVAASASGYQGEGPYTLFVSTTAPVRQDFCLMRPDIEVDPEAFDVIGFYTAPVTYSLGISNEGHLTLTWKMREVPPMVARAESLTVRPAYFGVDPYIEEEYSISADGKAEVFLAFSGEVDLSPATKMDWEARGRWVVDTLQALANRSQARVRRWLDAQGVEYTVHLNNTIFARLTHIQLEQALAFPEVVGAFGNHVYPLEPIVEPDAPSPETQIDWGLLQVHAPETWSDFGARGQNIVVANIDTGVQWNHPALDQAYLCPDNPTDPRCWYDPSNVCGGKVCDNNGHGTHTMGTMVGDDDPALLHTVGMAPDARFIMCKGCRSDYCYDTDLFACADWVLHPGGNSANRPQVVNNSWGGGSCDPFYRNYVTAWRASGIFPAFAIGNDGPGCSSLASPGDYPESFASGATGPGDAIAYFSSRGPSCWSESKPDVSAPGVSIYSSVPTNGWAAYSGTSMASPHTAGLVAMLWSCNPNLIGNIAATEYLITSTASCLYDPTCGGTPCPGGANNVYGWGRIDAYAAAEAGCLMDIPWVWEDLPSDSIPPGESVLLDVAFRCPVGDRGELTGTLRIRNNDPCSSPLDIPLTLHCPMECDPLTSADFAWAPLAPGVGTPVLFTASYEPPTASTPLFGWTFGDGETGSGITATHIYTAPGNYVVTLTATNPCSEVIVTHTVAVSPVLEPDIGVTPTGLFSQLCTDAVTTRTLSLCNTGSAPLVWSLTEISGVVDLPPFEPLEGSLGNACLADLPWLSEEPISGTVLVGECQGVTVTFLGLSPGDYQAGLLIQSNDPDEVQVTVPVTMTVWETVGGVDFTWNPLTPTVGQEVTFTATVATGTGPFTYTWTFGDGGTGSGNPIGHAYAAAGTHNALLTVTNVCGAATAAHAVVVRPAHVIYLPLVFKGQTP